MVKRVSSYFPKGGHSATETENCELTGSGELISLVQLGSPMPPAKFQMHQNSCFEEDFKMFLLKMGVATIFVKWHEPYVNVCFIWHIV